MIGATYTYQLQFVLVQCPVYIKHNASLIADKFEFEFDSSYLIIYQDHPYNSKFMLTTIYLPISEITTIKITKININLKSPTLFMNNSIFDTYVSKILIIHEESLGF